MSEEQNNTPEQQEQAGEQQAPNITVEDIVMTQRVIATASSRGAFKANEMSTVGGLYDRVSAFVQHHVKPEEKAEGETSEGSEGEASEGEAKE